MHPYQGVARRTGRRRCREVQEARVGGPAQQLDAVQPRRRPVAAHQLRAEELERRRPHPPVDLLARDRPRAPADPLPSVPAQAAGQAAPGPARRERPDREEYPAPREDRQLVHTPNDPRKRDSSHPLWKTR
ncbi:hypothetical protein BN2537_6447 [Streptomyces venezuelae]|nr:hypothetical protein BN2537_6447 [Streptomyces venezuelae]